MTTYGNDEPAQPIYEPAKTAPVERKVTASTTAAAGIVGLLMAVLATVEGDQLMEGFPDWVSVLVAMLIAAGGTFLAGKSAPHTARPDLPPDER